MMMIMVIFQKCVKLKRPKSLVNEKGVHFYVHPLHYAPQGAPVVLPIPCGPSKECLIVNWIKALFWNNDNNIVLFRFSEC